MVAITNLLEFIGGLKIVFGLLMFNLCILRTFVGLEELYNMMLDSYVGS
jgi:hypothetical protein